MADVDTNKRNFLARAVRVLGGVALLQAGWVAVSALVSGQRAAPLQTASSVRIAGPVERFERGSVTAFADGQFYLVRLNDGGFLAMHRKCTHLGCSVPWNPDEQRFACPCHASAFDIHGAVLNAPAPRPLDLFAVTIDNGIVSVDTGQAMRRNEFELTQVVRA